MGLDTSHDCWHGPYSRFHCWRTAVARAAGKAPLMLMEGFFKAPPVESLAWMAPRDGGPLCGSPHGPLMTHWIERHCCDLPLTFDGIYGDDPLRFLLDHSDCDGEIQAPMCLPIAARLEDMLPRMDEWKGETQQFIDGLRLAASRGENVEFH